MKNKKNTLIFIFSLIGLIITVYLSRQYLTGSQVVCLTGGCEKVRLSQFSKIGGIPVPLFGLVGYSLIMVFSFLRTLNTTLETKLIKPIFYISLGGLIFSLYNNLIDWLVIKAFCQYCFVCLLLMTGLSATAKSEIK